MDVCMFLHFETGLGGEYLWALSSFFFLPRTSKYSTVETHCQKSCSVLRRSSVQFVHAFSNAGVEFYMHRSSLVFFFFCALDNVVMTLPHFNFFFFHSSKSLPAPSFAATMVLRIIYYIIIVTIVEKTAKGTGEMQSASCCDDLQVLPVLTCDGTKESIYYRSG